MKDVWDSCRFRSDVISADFSKAKFAVELHEFLDGTADRTYQDPRTFFDNTFLTDQMKLLVRGTMARLDKGGGQPVTVIDTGFGGGKTHSLLLLHHILNNPDIGLEFVRDRGVAADVGIDTIPQARIVEIDCRKITKNTLWGEIAHRLGRYAEFEDMDVRREPPTDITKMKRLFDGPVLVMLDELPHYLFKVDGIKVGAKTLSELTVLYIMELISAVASTQRACLILTLTENQNLYEAYSEDIRGKVARRMSDFRVDDLVGSLTEAISRQADVMTPVNPDQIYNVVKARLVERVDEESKRSTIQEYADYYEKHGMDVGDMLEKMEKSYPFHPSLIDVLHDRVSTIGKFNQTRGMLRLLARIVRQVVEEKPACKMIGTSEVRFDNADIKDELTVRLDLNLGTVMDVDCVTHAKESDRTKSVSVVGPIAATTMLFSLHGHTKKSGIRRGDVKAAVGQPGLDPSLVDKALDEDIMTNFWYIHDVGGQEFYFDEFPNINAIIHDHKRFVTPTDIREEIRRALTGLLPPGGFRAVLWDRNDLADDNALKLFVTNYDEDLGAAAGGGYMEDILSRSGDGIRTNKNTIAIVYAEKEYVQLLKEAAKTLVGIKKAKKDERVKADRQFVKDIAGKENDALAQLETDCRMTYSHVMYPHGAGIRHNEIRFGESKKTTITDAVVDVLESQGKLVRNIGPDGLEVGDTPVKIKQIYKRITEDKSKPFVLHMGSIGEAVKDGLRTGKFGYFTEEEMVDGAYVVETDVVDFDWDGYLVDGGMVYVPEPSIVPEPPTQSGPGGPDGPEPTTQKKFRYEVRLGGFEEIYGLVKRTPTLNLDEGWKSSKKVLVMKLSVGEMLLTIENPLTDHKPLKDVLDVVSTKKPTGEATINVVSDSDLGGFFREYDLEAHER